MFVSWDLDLCVCVCSLRCALERWRGEVIRREREREQEADQLHCTLLRRRAWHCWREVCVYSLCCGVHISLCGMANLAQ